MTVDKEWLLLRKETRRFFSNSTWVPLRASINDTRAEVRDVDYISDSLLCGSVAFPPEHRQFADGLSWDDIGIRCSAQPYAFKDGYYSSIEQYNYDDKNPIGVHLVFEHPQPVIGGKKWILNPDLVVALRLIKEGNNWVRPEEDFVIVAREIFDKDGNHEQIEIKREFLLDYLAARNLALRLSYYRQRVTNVLAIEGSPFEGLKSYPEDRDYGRFKLRIQNLQDVFGGSWALFRVWRTDVDEEADAPILGPETNDNSDYEKTEGHPSDIEGVRVEAEFWRDEWIDHQGRSIRVRGDLDDSLPQFIVETDGSRMPSVELDDEDIGRWLWFRSTVVSELLSHREFSLEWYTAETGGIRSTSGRSTHFGINTADLITVYAYDIARLAAWEQHVWAAHNVAPDGKVSAELMSAQVRAQVANTRAVEDLLFKYMRMLEAAFKERFNIKIFNHDIDEVLFKQQVSRFLSKDRASLLRLAKELVRVFTDRLDARELRKLSKHVDKEKLGTNKLLQDILAQSAGAERARAVFGPIVGTYEMRLGDAHPTSASIGEAFKLAGINQGVSFLRQGEQLIQNFGDAIYSIGDLIFGSH